MVMKGVRHQLGPGYEQHFSPGYNPWDQRLCMVPDADLFNSMRAGKASVVTDQIDSFTERGVRLTSGNELEADIVVAATGLDLRLMHGLELVVDGRPVDMSKTMAYKGMMFSDVPNLAAAFGYTNASWTLKCDLTSEYVCKLLNYMDRFDYLKCTPRKRDASVKEEPVLDFTSGYVQRALGSLPKQGSKTPWRLHQNYALDLIGVRFNEIDDGVMEFRR
jgi:cation diffusion facilitator CzcD-associated flavoprotein CzcO